MDSIPLKHCNGCNQDKSPTLEFFSSDKSKSDKLRTRCKTCDNIAQKNRRNNPPPKIPDGYKKCSRCSSILPYTPEYFHRNGKQGLTSMCKPCRKLYVEKMVPPEKRLAQSRYYEALPEYQEKRKRYRESHRQETSKRTLQHYYEHKEQRREWARNHYAKHPETARIKSSRHRARANAVPGKHTAKQIRELYDRQKGKCYYCQKKIKWGKHTIDHIVPLTREGATNNIDNLVIACRPCNSSKRNKLPHEWGNRLL